MSKSERNKGAEGEREICALIHDHLGIRVNRNLMQSACGGSDIKLSPYAIEVKRRARIGNIYDWMKQAKAGCSQEERPIVFCRADREQWLAVMPIEEAFRLMREELDLFPWELEE